MSATSTFSKTPRRDTDLMEVGARSVRRANRPPSRRNIPSPSGQTSANRTRGSGNPPVIGDRPAEVVQTYDHALWSTAGTWIHESVGCRTSMGLRPPSRHSLNNFQTRVKPLLPPCGRETALRGEDLDEDRREGKSLTADSSSRPYYIGEHLSWTRALRLYVG